MTDPTVHRPEQLGADFTRLFNGGDIEALMRLYERSALFQPQADQEARGAEGISRAFQALRASGVSIHLRLERVRTAGGLALLSHTATIRTLASGDIVSEGPTVEVARRQDDGTWRYVVDDPTFLDFLD